MGTNQDDEIEIDLKELFYVIKRKLWRSEERRVGKEC